MKKFFTSLHLKKGDFVIFFVIGAMILTSTLFFFSKSAEPTLLKIYIDSKEYRAYRLSQKYLKNIIVPVDGDTKYGYNHIRIEDGLVFMADSTCPNQDCMRMGHISKAGDILVCLPHKLVVRLEGGEAVDAVSY